MLVGGLSPLAALGIVAYILWNTLRPRPARTALILPIVLIVVGATSLSQYMSGHVLQVPAVLTLAASLLFDAVGLGALRAYTVRLWSESGQVWMRGTWLTVALWVAGIAIHALLDRVAGVAEASALLYLGLTWTAQRLVVDARGRGFRPEVAP